MPTPYGRYGLSIPTYPERLDGPGNFQAFAESLEDHLYGIAFDEADRDTRFASVPPGGLVVSHERKAVWMKLADDSWHTVSRSIAIDTGFEVSAGWSLGRFEAWVENDRLVTVALEVTRTGGPINGGTNGDMANTEVGYFPPGARPGPNRIGVPWRSVGSSGSGMIGTSGQFLITDMNSNSTIYTDNYLTLDHTFRRGA